MSRRITVLWLIKGLGPGGAETLLLSFARLADHSRFAYHAAYIVPWKHTLVEPLEELGVPAQLVGGRRRPGWLWPLRLRKLLLSSSVDVLHLHSPSVAAVARVTVLTLPPRRRPVVVSTEHNTWDSYGRLTRWGNAVTSVVDRRRWTVSSRVHHSVWPAFRRHCRVLVHGLVLCDIKTHAPQVRAKLRAEWGAGPDSVVVCTVANFRPNKSYPNLLRAAAMVLKRHPSTIFISVGQGPLEGDIRALRDELGLDRAFRLLGYRPDVYDVLNASDIFALGSKHEGFPIAVMEALASGKPVVATDVGGVSDAVTPGVEGILVRPEDPAALADAISQLIDSPDRLAKMRQSAVERGADFDMRNAVRKIEGYYVESVRLSGGAG